MNIKFLYEILPEVFTEFAEEKQLEIKSSETSNGESKVVTIEGHSFFLIDHRKGPRQEKTTSIQVFADDSIPNNSLRWNIVASGSKINEDDKEDGGWIFEIRLSYIPFVFTFANSRPNAIIIELLNRINQKLTNDKWVTMYLKNDNKEYPLEFNYQKNETSY